MARNIPSRGRAQPVRGTSPFSSVRRMPARAAKFRTGMANPAPTSTRNPTRSPTRNEAGVNPEQPTRNDSTENNHSVEAGSNSSFIRSRAPSPSPRTALFHNAAPTGSQAVLSEEERVNSWIEAVEHADGRKGVIMSTDSPLYIKTIRIPQTDDGLSYSGTTTITDSVVRRGQILQKDTAEEEIAKMRAGDLSNAADIEEPEKRVKKAQGGGVIKERKKFNTRALRAKARNAARKAATKEQCTIGGTVGNIANNVAPVNEHLGGGEHNVNQGSAPVDTSAYSAEDIEAACILMQMSGADAELARERNEQAQAEPARTVDRRVRANFGGYSGGNLKASREEVDDMLAMKKGGPKRIGQLIREKKAEEEKIVEGDKGSKPE